MSHILTTGYGRKPQATLPIRNVERNYDRRRDRVQLIRNKFRRLSDSPQPPKPQKGKVEFCNLRTSF